MQARANMRPRVLEVRRGSMDHGHGRGTVRATQGDKINCTNK